MLHAASIAVLAVVLMAPVAVIHAQEAEQPPATPAPTPTHVRSTIRETVMNSNAV